jgi:hypothetical protein
MRPAPRWPCCWAAGWTPTDPDEGRAALLWLGTLAQGGPAVEGPLPDPETGRAMIREAIAEARAELARLRLELRPREAAARNQALELVLVDVSPEAMLRLRYETRASAEYHKALTQLLKNRKQAPAPNEANSGATPVKAVTSVEPERPVPASPTPPKAPAPNEANLPPAPAAPRPFGSAPAGPYGAQKPPIEADPEPPEPFRRAG